MENLLEGTAYRNIKFETLHKNFMLKTPKNNPNFVISSDSEKSHKTE
jgi:hypothetical protein